MSSDLQLPAARPAYVLRGHASQIHALSFSPDNSRLLTGDAHGWLVSWSLAYKRPVVSWRAHENAVLGLAWWDEGAVISHGRDSKLVVWKLAHEDEAALDSALPADQTGQQSRKPVVLHELTLNTMNFCSFSWCFDNSAERVAADLHQPILLAVPHTLDSEAIDVFHLPSTDRLSTIPAPQKPEAGMAMAMAIACTASATMVAVGYESGHILVYSNTSRTPPSSQRPTDTSRPAVFREEWNRLYLSNPHSQPVLSLTAAPDSTYFVTSAADSVIAKHPFRSLLDMYQDVDGTIGQAEEQPLRITKTKHAGQQGISIRNDGKLLATAGWDGRMRLYSTKTGKELAVLKWHREGCYTTAFASVQNVPAETVPSDYTVEKQGLTNRDAESGTEVESSIAGAFGLPKTPAEGSSLPTSLVAKSREQNAQTIHWLAAGSKDGKISLWDVY